MKFFNLLLIVSVSLLSSQNYTSLKCQGEIPGIFVNGMNNYIDVQEDVYKDYYSKDEDLVKMKENLILGSALNYSFYFRSGLILFGDPVTNYLNRIKSEILKNRKDLQNKIQVYTLKTSEVNAYSTLDGNVYVTLGLLARIGSEAELAFVLSHEIAHYNLKHTLESLKVQSEVDKLSKERKNLTLDDLIKFKLQRSQQHEFEADSLGFILFNESSYKNDAAIDLLTCLSLSHQPIGNAQFDIKFFNSGYFFIPECFYLNNVKELESKENQNDVLSSHPDILRRKEKIRKKLTTSGVHGSSFIQEEKQFNEIKNIAAFELLQRLIANRNYADAIYTSYCLLKTNPDNYYLKMVFVKALYAASIYKNNQAYHYTVGSYIKSEGEVQQVQYFLKNLNASQLNTLALRIVVQLKKAYPDDKDLDNMETSLIESLVMVHNITPDLYYNTSKAKEQFETKYSNYIQDTVTSKIQLRQNYKNFYLCGLYEIKEDQNFLRKVNQALEKKKKRDTYNALPYKEKVKVDEEKKRLELENGLQIKADKILFLEPEYFKYERDIKDAITNSSDEKTELVQELKLKLKGYNKDIRFVSASSLGKTDTEIYNDYSIAINWLQERQNHLSGISVSPVMGNLLRTNSNFGGYKYIVCTDIVRFRSYKYTYVFSIYNIETGERLYHHYKTYDGNIRINRLLKYILEDFEKTIN